MRSDTEIALTAIGVERPSTEAQWLVEEVSGMDASQQLAHASEGASRRAVSALQLLVERRASGEPLQYVLGSWSFCGIDISVDRRVLIPRPETEVVAQVAIAEVRRCGGRVGPTDATDAWSGNLTVYAVADLGTGSGAIALALAAALPDAEIWATDVSEGALAVARANVAGVAATRVRLGIGSWFSALPDALRGSLLVVTSNPPYVSEAEYETLPLEVASWEPVSALVSGPTGLEAIEVVVGEAPSWLAPEGSLVVEIGATQASAAIALALDAGFVEAFVIKDLVGRDRVLVARLTY